MSASPASDGYIHATFKVRTDTGIPEQIRKVLIHLDSFDPAEIPKDKTELVQFWVELILDNQIDNDHERLWEIGEQG